MCLAVRPIPRLTGVVGGLVSLVVFPVPNWPLLLFPQHLTVSSSRMVQVCEIPAEMCLAVRPTPRLTGVVGGLVNWVLFPVPSWPFLFFPQHLTVPLSKSAQEYSFPADTCLAVRPVPRLMGLLGGLLSCTKSPVPSCPPLFRPQHFTVLLPRSAQVWSLPGETLIRSSHFPFRQIESVLQALLQEPQFLESVCRFLHTPLQKVCSVGQGSLINRILWPLEPAT